jgi:hypothetical protein
VRQLAKPTPTVEGQGSVARLTLIPKKDDDVGGGVMFDLDEEPPQPTHRIDEQTIDAITVNLPTVSTVQLFFDID